MKKRLLALSSLILLASCQSAEKVPTLNDAMGWKMEATENEGSPYVQIEVEEGSYAQSQGLMDGDLIAIEAFVPDPANYDETPEPKHYLKEFTLKLCEKAMGLDPSRSRSIDMDVLRDGELIRVPSVVMPEATCA